MKKNFFKRSFAFVLLLSALCTVTGLGWPTAAEAKKIKVEVEVDDDDNSNNAQKKKSAPAAAPATFPVTFNNKSGNKVSVSLLYYDKNAKNWRCRGWWIVEPQKKRSIKLPHAEGKPIYYYAELYSTGKVISPSGTSKGVNRNITKKAFSYLDGTKPKLNKPYKAHFVRSETDDGWFQLNIN